MSVVAEKMVRKEKYSILEVLNEALPFLEMMKSDKRARVDFDGDVMKMASDRYKCFLLSGTRCVSCGLEAEYFIKETDIANYKKGGSYHFNLYGTKNSEEILFTKDHIIPKSKGGKDHVSNYQTMCEPCNQEKGSEVLV